jgi:hypothetical protein
MSGVARWAELLEALDTSKTSIGAATAHALEHSVDATRLLGVLAETMAAATGSVRR